MAEFMDSGRVQFPGREFKTSEVLILRRHLNSIIYKDRLFTKGSIAKAYECAKQLQETVDSIK